jgi:hypothetical protein
LIGGRPWSCGGKRGSDGIGRGFGEVWDEGSQRILLVVLLEKLYVLLGHPESILQLLQRSFKLDFALGVNMDGVVSAQVHVVGVSKIFPSIGAMGMLAGESKG